MKSMQRIFIALAFAAVLPAQTPLPPPPPPLQQRVFMLKYADARNVAGVLSVFGYGIKADRDLHVVAVSAPAEAMSAIEDAVKRLDVPAAAPRDIDLTVYMIVASQQASPDAGLPPELQPVAAELKKIFGYKNFHLLDTMLLRAQPGYKATAHGVTGTTERSPYTFEVVPVAITEDSNGRLIRLDNLNLSVHLPGDRLAGISTEISVREGQKAVVGKSNMGIDQSLILVVTAKVVD